MCKKKNNKTFCQKKFNFFNRAPSDTLKVFFGKDIYYFFSMFVKSVFCINSKILFQQYTDFVKNYYLFLKNYFKICISKSFMRPCFFLFTLQQGNVCRCWHFNGTLLALQQHFNGALTALQQKFYGTSVAQKKSFSGLADVDNFLWYFINYNKMSKNK